MKIVELLDVIAQRATNSADYCAARYPVEYATDHPDSTLAKLLDVDVPNDSIPEFNAEQINANHEELS